MKFISFAVLSALACFSTAAPAPNQGQCVPEQGFQSDFSYDLAGFNAYNNCGVYISLLFESGVFKFKSSYNYFSTGSTFNFCSKSHAHLSGAKAVDSEGNRYNVMQISDSRYDETDNFIVPSSDSVQKYHYAYKLVGQGPLENSIATYSFTCHYSYNLQDGYTTDCTKQSWSLKCPA